MTNQVARELLGGVDPGGLPPTLAIKLAHVHACLDAVAELTRTQVERERQRLVRMRRQALGR